jgi:hypothetical protein
MAIGKENLLIVKPLAPGKGGGFSKLSDVANAFVYVLVPYMIMIIASFFKEATPASFHNYLLLLGFIPVFFLAFFMPLISFRVAMKKAKTDYLTKIATRYNAIHDALLEDITQLKITEEELEKRERELAILKKMHDHLGTMAEWPIRISSIYRFLGSFSVPPVLGAVFKYALKIFKG